MGGLFGICLKDNCAEELFYGTDYHSHLGTEYGGLAVNKKGDFERSIHNLKRDYFRSKFESDLQNLNGNKGIGVISDTDAQPLVLSSHLGNFGIVTVAKISNLKELVNSSFRKKIVFSETNKGEINPTSLVATLICQEDSFEGGIQKVQESIDGSCSLLLLTEKGIYAARDKLGRTPVIIGKKKEGYAIASETCAFPNLDFEIEKYLGPSEIVFVTEEGIEQKKPQENKMQICSFLWVYYGFPASNYEDRNVESVRYKCGTFLGKKDKTEIDLVAGIPDSGIGHALGYSEERHIPYKRPFVKYTPTWSRSFMPQDQNIRNLVAKMKLIPIKEIIEGKRILFCEDSIVRGTQLQNTIQRLYNIGALEVHMRPACPPLLYGCKFLNFSRSKSELDLAGRKAINEIDSIYGGNIEDYIKIGQKRDVMIDRIKQRLRLTTLKYQELEDLVKAIGLPKEKLCTYCWDGVE